MNEVDHGLDELDGLDPREQAFYAALAREATGTTEAPTADDLALVEAVLAQHLAAADFEAAEALPARRGTVRWAVAVLAVAAAVVLSWMALVPELSLRGSQGTWIAQEEGRRHLGEGEALPLAVWLVAEGEACGEWGGASVCAVEGTVVRLHAGSGRRVELEVGRGAVTIDGALPVRTPAGSLLGEERSRFEVRVSADGGRVEVEVSHGSLKLHAPEGSRALQAGDHVQLGAAAETVALAPEPAPERAPTEDPTAEAPPSTRVPARPTGRSPKPTVEPLDPGALLVQARARLGESDKSGAAKLYTTLIEAHPASAEAQAARVSLGQLRLAAGRHKAALSLFSRYLEHGGPLAEEALWGKIRATAGLGRTAALQAAVDELVRRFPSSVYRVRAQELLAR